MNKVANYFWTADPVAQLQYEYDKAVDQMKEGREGLGAVSCPRGAGFPAGKHAAASMCRRWRPA